MKGINDIFKKWINLLKVLEVKLSMNICNKSWRFFFLNTFKMICHSTIICHWCYLTLFIFYQYWQYCTLSIFISYRTFWFHMLFKDIFIMEYLLIYFSWSFLLQYLLSFRSLFFLIVNYIDITRSRMFHR